MLCEDRDILNIFDSSSSDHSFNQCSDDSVPILSAAPRLLAKCRVPAHANWQCPYDELRVQHRLATTPLRLQDLSRARCRSCSGHVRAWVGQDETQLVSKIGRSRQVWAALTLATLRKQHIVLTLPLNSLVQLRPFLARPLHSDTRPRRNGKRRASKSMGPVGMLLAPQTWRGRTNQSSESSEWSWQRWQGDNVFRCFRASRAMNCRWLKTKKTSLPPQIRRWSSKVLSMSWYNACGVWLWASTN